MRSAIIKELKADFQIVAPKEKCIVVADQQDDIKADLVFAVKDPADDSGVIIIPFPTGRFSKYWPELHSERVASKDRITSGRFREIVRIAKTMAMRAGYPDSPRQRIKSIWIESLLWNVPDRNFAKPTLVESTLAVFRAIGGRALETEIHTPVWKELAGRRSFFSNGYSRGKERRDSTLPNRDAIVKWANWMIESLGKEL